MEKNQIKENLYRALEALESDDIALVSDIVEALDTELHPDRIAIKWSVDDVLSVVKGITRDEAGHVLGVVDNRHDCNYGVTWDTLSITAQMLYPNASDNDDDEEDDL